MNPEEDDLLQTGLRERDEAENEPLLAMKTTTVAVKAALIRRMKMMALLLW